MKVAITCVLTVATTLLENRKQTLLVVICTTHWSIT